MAPATDWRPTVADGLRRLRIRLTATAVLVVGVALVVAAIATVSWVGRSMTNSVREAAQARTAQVAARILAGDGTPVPADPQEETVQLLGPGESLGPVTIEGDYVTESTDLVLPSGAHRTIVVSRGIDDVQDAQRAVAHALWIAIPVLLVLVGVVTWAIAGVTLRPVRAANERQRRFVADAAHELRSPVASIRQHAEVASAHPSTTDVQELATTVSTEGVRLQALVDDLLLLARLRRPGRPGRVDARRGIPRAHRFGLIYDAVGDRREYRAPPADQPRDAANPLERPALRRRAALRPARRRDRLRLPRTLSRCSCQATRTNRCTELRPP